MANWHTDLTTENALNDVADKPSHRGRSNPGLVRIDNKPFESPRGRGRGNPGWGRLNNIPFVSQRGGGRTTRLESRSEDPNTASGSSYEDIMHVDSTSEIFDPEQHERSNPGLVRIDNKPFESPRGRGRGNPGWGRLNNMPFVSQRGGGRVRHMEERSEPSASCPSYENIMDIE